MFDTLIESTTRRGQARTPLFLAGTAAVWLFTFASVVVIGIFAFDAKVNAESDTLKLTAIVPPQAPPPPPARTETTPRATPTVAQPMTAVQRPPVGVHDPLPPRPTISGPGDGTIGDLLVGGVPDGIGTASNGAPESTYVASSGPPPPPPPAVVERPAPPRIVKVSDLRAGRAIRRVEPPYPAMAKSIGVEGSVVIEVTVGETGQVIATKVVSGHPLLRTAAESAARQWLFSPTILSDVPVKVIGTITFNFRKS